MYKYCVYKNFPKNVYIYVEIGVLPPAIMLDTQGETYQWQ